MVNVFRRIGQCLSASNDWHLHGGNNSISNRTIPLSLMKRLEAYWPPPILNVLLSNSGSKAIGINWQTEELQSFRNTILSCVSPGYPLPILMRGVVKEKYFWPPR